MIVHPTHDVIVSTDVHVGAPHIWDPVVKRGRILTIVAFIIVPVLLCAAFYWIGTRRINNFFSVRGDEQYQQQNYPAAADSYNWALRFVSNDAHALLNRGYAQQNQNDDQGALADFTRYIAFRPSEDAQALLAPERLEDPGRPR